MAKYDLSEKETRISPVLSRKEPDICKQERYSTYKRNIEARSRNHCCAETLHVLHILSICL